MIAKLMLAWVLAAPPLDVDARAKGYVDQYFGTVGVAIVVLRGGEASLHFAGEASKDGRVVLGPDTLFEIGSITKVFTTLLLQQAVDAGQVKLDTAAADLLPKDVPFPRAITLEHLATHRSGLPRLPGNAFTGPLGPLTERGNPYAAYDDARLYSWARTYDAKASPGGAVGYSNLGAGLLGHLLARRANVSYQALLDTGVLTPLGMKDTAVSLDEARRRRFADGHGDWGTKKGHWDFQAMAPAGALRSTPRDMLQFLRANVGTGPPALVAALKRAHARRHETHKGAVGLGWWRLPLEGRTVVWHNGGTGGFRSYLGFFEGTRTGVVALGNSSTPVDALAIELLRALAPPLRK